MLAFRDVSRRYGRTQALADVSFELPRGGLTVVAGPNGAGKSTLLRLAASLERPSAGRIDVAGHQGAQARRHVAWLGQEPGLYDELTVAENLAFVAGFFDRRDEVEPAAAAFGIAHKLDERARRLSRGERQRAALARALLGGELMLLDEPTTALDADASAACIAMLDGLRETRTILVATHEPELVKRADHVLRLDAGRLS